MKQIARVIAALAVSVALGACATASSIGRDKIDAAVIGVNYTSDYIDFTLMSPLGENLDTGGDAKPFSEGGTGGTECCARLPGVGQTVHVELRVGRFNDTADRYKIYSRDVVVKGATSTNANRHSYLIVRFFPNHEVEAEFIPGDDPRGMRNPRVDKLLLGQRVMRQMGE